MLKTNKSRMAFILSVFSALCLFGAGCKQQAEDVPALNKEPAQSDAFAQADADAKAKAEADAKAAEKTEAAAKADAEAKMAADAKAADDARIAAEAKIAADAKHAEDAKVAADAKAAEDAKMSDDAKAAADAKAASDTKVAADAKPESDAKVVEASAVPAKTAAENAPVVAAAFASQLVSTELNKHFGANHGLLVVQVNRATNRSDVAVNRSEVLRVMQDAFAKKSGVVSTNALQGPGQVKRPKAIHLAFDVESKALGLIPSSKVSDAPSVILNTVVEGSEKDAKLTVNAIDARTGKVFWTDSKSLASASEAQCGCDSDDDDDKDCPADPSKPGSEHPEAACPMCKE